MQLKVKIRKVFNNDKSVKAIATVIVDGSFVIHNVRVIETEKKKYVAMPYFSYKDAEGMVIRKNVVHPKNSEVQNALEEAVLTAYEQKISTKSE